MNTAKKTLLLDASSGISGDMCVAALLDLGADANVLKEVLSTLPVDGFEIAISRLTKSGLAACDFDVILDAEHENHDHDMEWLFGHEHHDGEHYHEHHSHCHTDEPHEHYHEDGQDHGHTHEHDHGDEHGDEHADNHNNDHAHHHHHHEHRSLAEVNAIIEGSNMNERAKGYAHAIFAVLADAEAKAHGATPETVHFHEVGAVDSVVDICSVAILLDNLDIDEVIVPELTEGHGTIHCAHGIMPIPVPAVAHICEAKNIVLKQSNVHGELVTPTGAAIVGALRTSEVVPQQYSIVKTGYGAGKRTYEGCSGLLRAMIIKPSETSCLLTPETYNDKFTQTNTVTKLETNLDDCTGEALGRVIDLLLQAGARDAWATPIIMKKGRPAYQLSVLCDDTKTEELKSLIFFETTTIGIRSYTMERTGLARTPEHVNTRYGTVAVKRVMLPDGSERVYPEYDSVAALCKQTGASFQDVFRAALLTKTD